jgi:hypothetical protein
MDESKWLEQLKERADQSIFRELHFTSEMENRVRQKIKRRSWTYIGKGLSLSAAALFLIVLVWQIWPARIAEEHAAPSTQAPPSLLPGGILEIPTLWKPSPRTETTYENEPFTYVGEKPVRIITDEFGFYEGQQQRVFWLLDGSYTPQVELVGYSSDGKRIELGSYKVMDPLFDARGHFPSGITLPDPGVWKLQVLSGGKHLGQVFVVVKAGISQANRELVETLIRSYLETEDKRLGWLGQERETSIELLGVEAPEAERRKVYAWVKILGKDPRLSSGISSPMAFDIAYDGQEYRVTGFQMPEDGSNYTSSLQKIFPLKVLEQINKR